MKLQEGRSEPSAQTGHRFDFLVVGTGIAGLSAAIDASEHGTVAIVTKKNRAESNTNYAQGGIAAVFSESDSFDLHIRDTLEAGVGLCHADAVEILVREGPARVRELIDRGVRFTRDPTGLDLGLEGGHSAHRIVHSSDRSGSEIERALLETAASRPSIAIFEHHAALDLITGHHLHRGGERPITCYGIYALDIATGAIATFMAGRTILCTGGLGQVYLHTTNPLIATGDGVAMGFRAGASVANMEFIQFHPTALYEKGDRLGPAFLISEAVRGYGGVLRSGSGEEFMNRYHRLGSLAPRDIVARGIDAELKKSGEPCVWLDLTHKPAAETRSKFPHIHDTCIERAGIDITVRRIPVVPAAHYSCGGIVTDTAGRTTIERLYALGEVAMTGVHGANRLASNSLLEAVVFSRRAVDDLASGYAGKGEIPDGIPPWDDRGTFDPDEWVLIEHNRREIRQTMWNYVGIIRSDARLERARRRLELIRDEIEEYYRRTRIVEGLVELRNLATVAGLIVRAALLRRESRGLHYTTDQPERDDERWKRDTIL